MAHELLDSVTMNKQRRFFFHFNKPESLRQKKTLWSIHWNNACYIVDKIECNSPCESKANKHQPYAVMRGFTNQVTLITDVDGTRIAVID